jgi:ketosteroid isomerase-like protein
MPEESTTPDLEDAIRPSIEAFARGDFDAAMTLYAPNAVWDASQLGLRTFEGTAAIREMLEHWLGSYEDYEEVEEEFRDFGNGVGFRVTLVKGRPLGSTGFVQMRQAMIALVESGVIARITVYLDIDEARAAAERLAQERG